MVYSWQIPRQLWCSLAYNIANPSIAVLQSFLLFRTSELAMQALEVTWMSRMDSVSVRKMLTGFCSSVIQDCLKIKSYLCKKKSHLWIDSVYLHLDWSWMEQEYLNYGQTPIMMDTLRYHQEPWWGCLVKCFYNIRENIKPNSVSNLYYQSKSIF